MYFEGIIPCGILDCGVTSMEQLLDNSIEFNDVLNILIKQFSLVFKNGVFLYHFIGLLIFLLLLLSIYNNRLESNTTILYLIVSCFLY